MTDPQPTPQEEAAVRRLLREARHDGPVPPEVAARTEQTLASLGAAGPAPSAGPVASVGPAARGGAEHHRRRRAATALLVAAVSVVVVGIGLGQVVSPPDGQESGTAAVDSAGRAARDTPPDRAEAAQERDQGGADAQADTLDPVPSRPAGGAGSGSPTTRPATPVERLALVDDPPAVRESRFARDVRRVRALQQDESPRRSASSGPGRNQGVRRDPAPGFSCERTATGPGRAVAVRYDQAPAVLVLRPPTRATQVADLVECGSGDVVRSLTLRR